jgi:uncharacterized damage-inducible protein DinB
MPADAIRQCFHRELRSLRRELDAYPDDGSLWALPPGIKNSAGTLMLHLAGNLQHFIGACLGGTGYVRNRDAEFSRRDVSRAALAHELEAAAAAVDAGFSKLTDQMLTSDFPEQIAGITFMTENWLVHLVAHLGYHVGQIDYHRRLVTADSTTVDTVSVKELGAVLA